MNVRASALYTIGYQGRSPADFVERLHAVGVDLLVDVRANAFSYKPGFSKGPLRRNLAGVGIDYLHTPQFGNPKAVRAGATSITDCLNRFEDWMAPRWEVALAEISPLLRSQHFALMCYEADPAECHRSIVARHLSEALGCQHIPL